MTDAQLKPCPFCGSGNVKTGGDDKFVGAWCLNCGCVGPNHYDSRFDWNTRADLTPSVKPLEWRKAEDAPKGKTVLLWAADWTEPCRGYRGYDGDFYDVQTRCFLSDPTHCMVLSTPADQPTPSEHDAKVRADTLQEAATICAECEETFERREANGAAHGAAMCFKAIRALIEGEA